MRLDACDGPWRTAPAPVPAAEGLNLQASILQRDGIRRFLRCAVHGAASCLLAPASFTGFRGAS